MGDDIDGGLASSVAMLSNGNVVAIGAPLMTMTTPSSDSGSVRVYN
jgi:hypothetical protein